jgi:hypothetical protein
VFWESSGDLVNILLTSIVLCLDLEIRIWRLGFGELRVERVPGMGCKWNEE